VARQQDECRALAQAKGLEVVDVLVDNDASAYSGKARPRFESLLQGVEDGLYDSIVIFGSDRLYRSLKDYVRVADAVQGRGVSIYTVTAGELDLATPGGELNATVLAGIGRFESANKAARITARAQQRARDERRTVAAMRPFGFRWADPCPGDVTCRHKTKCTPGQRPRQGSRAGLVLHPAESAALAQAFADVAEGATLYTAHKRLAATLDVGKMTPSTLGSILRRPRYAGLASYRGEITGPAADGLQVVDRALWERVQTILDDPTRRTSPGTKARTWLGGGLLRCGKCGGPMAASKTSGPGGTRVPVYVCSRHQCMKRRRHLLDPPVLSLAGEMLAALADTGHMAQADAEDDTETAALRTEITEAETRLAELAALVASGALDPRAFAAADSKIRAGMDAASVKLKRRARRPAITRLTGQADVTQAWQQLIDADDTETIRALLAELFESISAEPDGTLTVTFQPWTQQPSAVLHPAGPRLPDRDTRRADVARLHRQGRNVSQIATELGIARQTVRADLSAAGAR
jgi:DNA invertase Pin-like site-specific DNA recombinase